MATGVKVSQLPAFVGKLEEAIIPVIVNGQNMKFAASQMAPVYIQFQVGVTAGMIPGMTRFVDNRLANKKVIVFRNFIPQWQGIIADNSYIIKNDDDNFIDFSGALSNDFIQIIAVAL